MMMMIERNADSFYLPYCDECEKNIDFTNLICS